MKKVAFKAAPAKGTARARRKAPVAETARHRNGGILRSRAKPATVSALHYDAGDIEEANRLGSALCRQHAS